jgi:hypothetical protein
MFSIQEMEKAENHFVKSKECPRTLYPDEMIGRRNNYGVENTKECILID